jgi:DNA-binding FrmR family transcriptional regulator
MAVGKHHAKAGHAGHSGGVDHTHRHAAGVDPALKLSNLRRLRRIEGQVRGLQKMVEDERYCPDILVQVSSVQQALRAVSRELMRNHLEHCATQAIQRGHKAEMDAVNTELLDLVFKHSG